jgi:hypothetical protein
MTLSGPGASAPRRKRICRSRIQYSQNGRLETRQIVLNGMPDRLGVDPVVLMPEPVADPPDVPPWLPWASRSASSPKRTCRFANEQYLALDGRDGLWIRPERLQIHPSRELFDADDGFDNIEQREDGFPKRQARPLARLWPLPDVSATSLETDRPGRRAYRPVGFRSRPYPRATDGARDRTQR